MTSIVIDSASFCPGAALAEQVAKERNLRLLTDDYIFAQVAEACAVDAAELRRLVYGPTKSFAGIKDSRPKYVAEMRVALSARIAEDNLVLTGALGYLVPPTVSHVLKVGIVGNRAYRLAEAEKTGLSSRRAEQQILRDDEARSAWAALTVDWDPWDRQLFDILLPSHQLTLSEMAAEIGDNADKAVVQATEDSRGAVRDFQHAAAVQSALADRGHDVDVESRDGAVQVLIKRHTLFVERLKAQLEKVAEVLPGVKRAIAKPGPRYAAANLYLDVRSELPSKVLLVDDEKSFVQTLSRRLQNRFINSSVAYGGAEALIRVGQEEPDVMVLDLKMPGVDGMDVLRNVKANNPGTEVIILTAHGSEAEERLVYQMGAFAYLRKPVDIGELTDTMKRAYQKMREHQKTNE